MKIGIIGAGFTGLSAAYYLAKTGHEVSIIEKAKNPGGLALGFEKKEWEWTLEEHYHHWFTNDRFVLRLAEEINHPVLIKRPKTSVFLQNHLYQLDSLSAFLGFPKLSPLNRFRMLLTLGALRINPFWRPLEHIRATSLLPTLMGEKAWNMLWRPQLTNKMGIYADDISLVWFWTRFNKRTPSLAYPEGGFLLFAKHLALEIEKNDGKIQYETESSLIQETDGKVMLHTTNKNSVEKKELFDKIIVTLPSFLFLKLAPSLPESYKQKMVKRKGLGATNMVIRLKKPFLKDGTYWLSICEKNAPVMVVVEHTNLITKSHYNNEHIIYVGNYPETTSPLYTMSNKELLDYYDPLLKRINHEYRETIIDYTVFRTPFAQPIIPTNYSKNIPPLETPFKHVFLANIEQVYPWDRGTNYAVELGEKVAKRLLSE